MDLKKQLEGTCAQGAKKERKEKNNPEREKSSYLGLEHYHMHDRRFNRVLVERKVHGNLSTRSRRQGHLNDAPLTVVLVEIRGTHGHVRQDVHDAINDDCGGHGDAKFGQRRQFGRQR
jgi:hypothetical protein